MMVPNKLYYVKFEHIENSIISVNDIYRCDDIREEIVSLTSIRTNKGITSSNYDDCKDFHNNSGVLVTIREIIKEENPEYWL